jgi:hypothetical protein
MVIRAHTLFVISHGFDVSGLLFSSSVIVWISEYVFLNRMRSALPSSRNPCGMKVEVISIKSRWVLWFSLLSLISLFLVPLTSSVRQSGCGATSSCYFTFTVSFFVSLPVCLTLGILLVETSHAPLPAVLALWNWMHCVVNLEFSIC